MGQRKRRRAADRAIRPAMQSPGRPNVARREDRQRFWKSIARGLQSEEAAVECGVSPAVGTRWFRENGGMSPITLAPVSGRYMSLAEREEIALLKAQNCGVRDIARRSACHCAVVARYSNPPPRVAALRRSSREIVPGSRPIQAPQDRETRREPGAARVRAATAFRAGPDSRRPSSARPGGAVDRAASRSPQGPALGAGMEPGADRAQAASRVPGG